MIKRIFTLSKTRGYVNIPYVGFVHTIILPVEELCIGSLFFSEKGKDFFLIDAIYSSKNEQGEDVFRLFCQNENVAEIKGGSKVHIKDVSYNQKN